MRLGSDRRPGSMTAFIDTSSGETVLAIQSNGKGESCVCYRLHDRHGNLVADSDGFQRFCDGHRVTDTEGEVLLDLPGSPEAVICYRLYNCHGHLLTSSDGMRTQIFGYLQMQSGQTAQGAAWLRNTKQPDAAKE